MVGEARGREREKRIGWWQGQDTSWVARLSSLSHSLGVAEIWIELRSRFRWNWTGWRVERLRRALLFPSLALYSCSTSLGTASSLCCLIILKISDRELGSLKEKKRGEKPLNLDQPNPTSDPSFPSPFHPSPYSLLQFQLQSHPPIQIPPLLHPNVNVHPSQQ